MVGRDFGGGGACVPGLIALRGDGAFARGED